MACRSKRNASGDWIMRRCQLRRETSDQEARALSNPHYYMNADDRLQNDINIFVRDAMPGSGVGVLTSYETQPSWFGKTGVTS